MQKWGEERIFPHPNIYYRTRIFPHPNIYYRTYNLLISLLGIQNAPYEERQFDLASPTYQLNWEKVKTQHGTKSLSEKIDPHSRFK